MEYKGLNETNVNHIDQRVVLLVLHDQLVDLITVTVLHDVEVDSVFLLVVNNNKIWTVLNIELDVLWRGYIHIKWIQSFLVKFTFLIRRNKLNNVANVILNVFELGCTMYSLLINLLQKCGLLLLDLKKRLGYLLHGLLCFCLCYTLVEHCDFVFD